jgi:hypothetical protein
MTGGGAAWSPPPPSLVIPASTVSSAETSRTHPAMAHSARDRSDGADECGSEAQLETRRLALVGRVIPLLVLAHPKIPKKGRLLSGLVAYTEDVSRSLPHRRCTEEES